MPADVQPHRCNLPTNVSTFDFHSALCVRPHDACAPLGETPLCITIKWSLGGNDIVDVAYSRMLVLICQNDAETKK